MGFVLTPTTKSRRTTPEQSTAAEFREGKGIVTVEAMWTSIKSVSSLPDEQASAGCPEHRDETAIFCKCNAAAVAAGQTVEDNTLRDSKLPEKNRIRGSGTTESEHVCRFSPTGNRPVAKERVTVVKQTMWHPPRDRPQKVPDTVKAEPIKEPPKSGKLLEIGAIS